MVKIFNTSGILTKEQSLEEHEGQLIYFAQYWCGRSVDKVYNNWHEICIFTTNSQFSEELKTMRLSWSKNLQTFKLPLQVKGES